jgi:predicted transcriptional regulator
MSSLASNKELAQNKLILLYIIEKVNMPISNLQITKIVLGNKFMNYFLLQQYLNELCDDKLLELENVDDKSLYKITSKGERFLSYFPELVPAGIKSTINSLLSEIKKNIRNETLITADFFPESKDGYIVYCKIHEDDFPLINLELAVGTKSDARLVCKNWEQYSQDIYAEIIELLTKDRSEESS